ncbi:hypothetical protein LQ938_03045 [Microbacterium sp. cx-55]|uniref:hypothetical protein n=1 Tax=unclassified Microbacterium TaxID=2609290 RepID=UPI001CBE8F3B|nr:MULTISPECIES: hypothetical protein [unclassified Microbacterium]MBZ4486865.1 hypothetical protein [Microbacterium sp. cx-55]MCC4908067.1 hypothetical protein [Microbacterium sp. cx-59]UGB35790.1 hypothetical protein LQ938_03045 [Microbacterium sp. cx-55]
MVDQHSAKNTHGDHDPETPEAPDGAPLTSDSPELPDTTDENNRPVDNPSG